MLRRVSDAPAGRAISSSSASGTETAITSASGSEPDDWFGELARPLLGKEPGVALHYITGFPASTCAKYVAKTEASRRQPPAYLLRQLFRSEQGEPFLFAVMDGCEARWWIELKRDREHAAKFRTWVRNLLRDIDIQ